jgi:hypothetical protein
MTTARTRKIVRRIAAHYRGKDISALRRTAVGITAKEGVKDVHADGAEREKDSAYQEKSTSLSFVQLPISKGMLVSKLEPARTQ